MVIPAAGGGGFVGRTVTARAVLLDTGALLALAKTRDAHHADAVACLNELARLRLKVFVSVPTIHESHRRFLFDLGEIEAAAMLDRLTDGTINLEFTTEADEAEARLIIDRFQGSRLTLTDAANMALMLRLGIARAFSFDHHYLMAGFLRIPPLVQT